MDPQEAKNSLELIEQTQSAVGDIGAAGVGWLLIIWGAVWLAGFSLSHAASESWLLWVWLSLLSAGSAASAVVGMRMGREMQYTETGPRQAALYLLLFGFGALWLFLAEPATWEQIAVLAITFVGFATAISGILVRARSLVVLGLLGTAFCVLVYLLLLPYFGLIVGVAGGGGMIATGLRLRWGRSSRG